jgi:hypothetical protein
VCTLARDFLQEQDFPRSNLIRADHMGENLFLAAPAWHKKHTRALLCDCEPAGAASVEKAPVFRGSTVVLEVR